ncbi:bifunctional demethylmenaquinone methyltransferase/2-methoxy-6-polyprenyl-1,4-benzoquinol methylase UbiE [candidate division KSB1 bacterium]|nr:MAG: bifunctional demethylmenaquinone methyltransferase/2-methoxy-6-polyprenyl-1,4-benzoquinol methylase UbiE [candidate division KSB1 bacterium]
MKPSPNPDVADMFNRIAHTYDRLNHLLSFGIDRRWRKLAVRKLRLKNGCTILDCAAGTGDMALAIHDRVDGTTTVLLDPAHSMLCEADAKAGTISPARFRLICGSAERIPFRDNTFDGFVVAFGIRNFADLKGGLNELQRVLKSGGKGIILEFTPDRSRLIDRVFRKYMSGVMIPLGARISKDQDAYVYLTRTIQSFATSRQLTDLFTEVGFRCVENRSLSWGIARLFVLEKI